MYVQMYVLTTVCLVDNNRAYQPLQLDQEDKSNYKGEREVNCPFKIQIILHALCIYIY